MKKQITLITALIAATTANAAFELNDQIGVDFGSTSAVATNFNGIVRNTTINDAVLLSDGTTLSGVSVAVVAGNKSYDNNNPSTHADQTLDPAGSGGADTPFIDAVFDDWTGGFDVAGKREWSITIGNLTNPGLTYNLTVATPAWDANTNLNGMTIDIAGDTRSIASTLDTNYITFSGLSAVGNQIVVNLDSEFSNTSALSGFVLTAVPEPSAYALIAGLLGLSYVMVRRR